MPRYPLPLGSTALVPPVPPPPPPFWVPVEGNSVHWQAVTAGRMPRFEHLYPQTSGAEQQFVKIPPPESE